MIRGLLFILFLYVVLAWCGAAFYYRRDPDKLLNQGLLWTIAGVAALLLWLILERAMGWWRVQRAQKAAGPVKPVAQFEPSHEDDAALATLLNEANQRLAQAPNAVKPARVLDLPVYLVVGPEGAGKTALLHNCGLEPALLAGQVLGGGAPLTPTRVANLWLAQQSLFLEVGGRVFNGEPGRIEKFLSPLRRDSRAKGWKSWFRPPQQPILLRGVLLVLDSREFLGTPEPSRLDRLMQHIRERMAAIAGALHVAVPVYVLFTKADAIPHFAEFFTRLGEEEAGQVFGVLTPEEPRDPNQVWAEAATRRLNRRFHSLFVRLTDRRLLALKQEQEVKRKQAMYEFPREFKKIRTSLVQFLVDVFKPDPFKEGPRLRGFFFTGAPQTEWAATPDTDPASIYRSADVGSRMFGAEMVTPRSGSTQRWVFVTDFFLKVLNQDRPVVTRVEAPSKLEQYRRFAIGTATGLTIFLVLVWTISWIGNRELVSSAETKIEDVRRGSGDLSLGNLQAIERLREYLVNLQKNDWSLHWGLYTGGALREAARRAYFERLKQVSLYGINQTLIWRLQQSGTASTSDGTDSIYERLKTHRTIAARGCPVDALLISKVLKATASEAHPSLGEEPRALLNRQLDFYAVELEKRKDLPVRLVEDSAAVSKARDYLLRSSGLEQRLRSLLDDLNRRIRPLVVADYVKDYQSVLTGPAEFRGVFTKPGLVAFTDLVEKNNFSGSGENCVVGESAGAPWPNPDSRTREQIKSLYFRQYADAWRDFLGAYNVIPYLGSDDAARKLSKLADPQSPLLGIVKLVAENTNFPSAKQGEPSWWDRIGLGSLVQSQSRAEQTTDRIRQLLKSDAPPLTTADLARLFQPVLYTTPAELPVLVNDNNRPYVEGLRGLARHLDALARVPRAEKVTLIPPARAALDQAEQAHVKLADNFHNVGNEGLNKQLSSLLKQPILLADRVIPKQDDIIPGGKNAELAKFCQTMQPILTKYPFRSSNQSGEAAPAEITKGFAPKEGLVWKYAQSASDLVALSGQEWVQNPVLQGMRVAPELLDFLNQAQNVRKAFFGSDGTQPKLTYVLRPAPGQKIGIGLVLDGTEMRPHVPIQRPFVWPAPPGATPGAVGTVEVGDFKTGFGDYQGPWGVFQLFQNADKRELGTRIVQWSEIRGRGGARTQSLDPPAKIEFREFPGGDVDLFNPKFFERLQCPKKAVVLN